MRSLVKFFIVMSFCFLLDDNRLVASFYNPKNWFSESEQDILKRNNEIKRAAMEKAAVEKAAMEKAAKDRTLMAMLKVDAQIFYEWLKENAETVIPITFVGACLLANIIELSTRNYEDNNDTVVPKKDEQDQQDDPNQNNNATISLPENIALELEAAGQEDLENNSLTASQYPTIDNASENIVMNENEMSVAQEPEKLLIHLRSKEECAEDVSGWIKELEQMNAQEQNYFFDLYKTTFNIILEYLKKNRLFLDKLSRFNNNPDVPQDIFEEAQELINDIVVESKFNKKMLYQRIECVREHFTVMSGYFKTNNLTKKEKIKVDLMNLLYSAICCNIFVDSSTTYDHQTKKYITIERTSEIFYKNDTGEIIYKNDTDKILESYTCIGLEEHSKYWTP